MSETLKTLKIEPDVHEKLMRVGNKNETFSDIIDRLIEEGAAHE